MTAMRGNFILFGLILGFAVCAANHEAGHDDIQLEHQDSCSLFCFMLPDKKATSEEIQKNIDAVKDFNCSHLVYGHATIDSYYKINHANEYDYPMNSYWGNFQRLRRLRNRVPPVKVLLAVREKLGVHIDSRVTREKVIKNLIEYVDRHYFNGIFLNLRDTNLNSFYFEKFVDDLRTAIKERAGMPGKSNLMLVLALNAKDALYTNRKVRSYADKFDLFYLKGDESLTTESDILSTVLLDPIYTGDNVQFEDAISQMAISLINNGITENKIIIGLSANARGYNLVDRNETYHGAPVYEFARIESSKSIDGRFPYQDICHLPGYEQYEYWNNTVAVSFVDDDDNWFSLNKPEHESFARKVKYITSHGFGGLGIMNMEADDPTDSCGNGKYPLLTYVSKHLTCSKKRAVHGGTTECKRLCIYRPFQYLISFQQFKADWCSHFVISSAMFGPNGTIVESSAVKAAINSYNSWQSVKKPYLVLSIGNEMVSAQWALVIGTPEARKTLIESIWHTYNDNNLDGISIDFVLEPIGGATKNTFEKDNFHLFLTELKAQKPESATIFFTGTYSSTANDAYDIQKIDEAVDYVIIEGYNFHGSKSQFTVHHSPLFMDEESAIDSTRSIEGLAAAFVKRGINRDKVILGFTAAGNVMQVIPDPQSRADDGEADDKFLGLTVDHADVGTERSTGSGPISQTELCETLSQGPKHQFIDGIGANVAIKGNEFYSYDDARSIQAKTIWASLNHFAGVSLNAIEMDNPGSICPSTEPFNLLQKIAETQACEVCANPKMLDENANNNDDSCGVKPFRVICNYKLPSFETGKSDTLSTDLIPHEECDEVVLDEVLWTATNVLTFRDIGQQRSAHKIVEFVKTRTQLSQKFAIVIRCKMTPDELKALLESNQAPTNRILEYLEKFTFHGIELRCDHALNNENRDLFKDFVNELNNSFDKRRENHKCRETVSIRIPIWNKDLHEKYDLDQLNAVHQVVLETFEHTSNHARVVSPLFGFDKSNETHAIDSTVNSWIGEGIHPQKVIMQLPTYGLVQRFKNESSTHALNDLTEDEFTLIPQAKLCKMFKEDIRNVYRKRTLYDMVSSYATSKNEWISYETNETITYKVKFAIYKGLGGIGLSPINYDDSEKVCDNKLFPLLKTIHASICPKPVSQQ